jgi:ACS family pantothenate transporter-like MFS transporter
MIPLPIYLERRDKRLGLHQIEKADVITTGLDDVSLDVDNSLSEKDAEKYTGVVVVTEV